MDIMDDLDTLKRMYATLCGGIDDALSFLERGNVWAARQILQQALEISEELYITSISATDELAEHRTRNK